MTVAQRHITYVHVTDPTVAHGGSDLRFRAIGEALSQPGFAAVELSQRPAKSVRTRFAQLIGVLRGTPPRFVHPVTEPHRLQQIRRSGDLIVASTVWSASVFRKRNRARLIYDAHNIEWRVQEQLASSAKGRVRRLAYQATVSWARRWESRLVRDAAAVWAVTEDDAKWFQSVGARLVFVIPNGASPQPEPVDPGCSLDLLFVGSLRGGFNRQGVEWFLVNCWPAILRRHPTSRLRLIGFGSEDFAAPNVESLGFVDSLVEYYRSSRLSVVPLLNGGGSRLKIAEALSYGLPIVSTSIGAEGFPAGSTNGIRLADTAGTFAAECCEILASAELARELGTNAYRAGSAFTWSSIAERALTSFVTTFPGAFD